MKNKKIKSVAVSFRLPVDIVEDIDFLRESQGVDRGTFVKNALACFVEEAFDEFKKQAIKDYVKGIIDDSELREYLEKKKDYKIPQDIQEARKDNLNKLELGATR
jgi:predicted DNA-binding protein